MPTPPQTTCKAFNKTYTMQNRPTAQLDHMPGIVQRGELTPELVMKVHTVPYKRAAYLLDTIRHEAAHLAAAFACPGTVVDRVRINPAIRPRRRNIAEVESTPLRVEHDPFISLAGPVMELLMARERGTPCDDVARIASADDIERAKIESRRAGIDVRDIGQAVINFMRDARPAVDYITAVLLLDTPKSGDYDYKKIERLRQRVSPHIPPYDNYHPTSKQDFYGGLVASDDEI